jgi:hypothetical protein
MPMLWKLFLACFVSLYSAVLLKCQELPLNKKSAVKFKTFAAMLFREAFKQIKRDIVCLFTKHGGITPHIW